MNKNSFTVVDVKTGVYPDLEAIALHEDWAKGLVYCDMDGFAIMEDGSLILMDECDNLRYCPVGRFEIVWNDDEALLKEQEAVKPRVSSVEQRCGNCNKIIEMDGWKACPWCGKRIDWKGWWQKNGTRNQDT